MRLSRLDVCALSLLDRRGDRMARLSRAARRARVAREAWSVGEALFWVHAALGTATIFALGQRSPAALLLVVREPALALAGLLLLWPLLRPAWVEGCRWAGSAAIALAYTSLCASARLVLGGIRPSVFLLVETEVQGDLWLVPWLLATCLLGSWLVLRALRSPGRRWTTRPKVVQ